MTAQTNDLTEQPVPDLIRDLFEGAAAEAPDQVRGAPGADGAVKAGA